MLKKFGKAFLSLFMMLTIMTVSYAADVDNIFGITAHAASYKEKATSMIEFYKNGSALDRKKVSDEELYVFGIFVSNFLMPFQSQVGSVSSDSFVTQMAQMFFGDAYTAQQLSDMKYTLGLVQTAQSDSRKRLIQCVTGTPVSASTLYMGFKGFYSPTQQDGKRISNLEQYFTYEGSGYSIGNKPSVEYGFDDVVWATGTSAFDVILGQLISICPSQAGVYMGTKGNLTSNLYVDCFGNISDSNGIVIVPACMNPFAFYNRYLDENRRPMTSTGSLCPVQLPINNAFWMGTMVTPQSLSSRVGIAPDSVIGGADNPTEESEIVYTFDYTVPVGPDTSVGSPGLSFGYKQDLKVSSSFSVHEAMFDDGGKHDELLDLSTLGACLLVFPGSSLSDIAQLAMELNHEYYALYSTDDGVSYNDCCCAITIMIDVNNLEDPVGYGVSETDRDGIGAGDNIPCFDSSTCAYPALSILNLLCIDSSDGFSDALLEKLKSLKCNIYTIYDPNSSGDQAIAYFNDYATMPYNCGTGILLSDNLDFDTKITCYESFTSDTKVTKSLRDLWGEGIDTPNELLGHITQFSYGMYTAGELIRGDMPSTPKKDDVDLVYTIMDTYISLPNLYMPLSKWSDSTTILVGLNTLDGDELGIYFDAAINKAFRDAWAKASGNEDVSYATLIGGSKKDGSDGYLMTGKDGFFDAWNFVGGTAIPAGLFLDDIALFDTYNNFSDSLAESINVISMYRNKSTGTWWSADETFGTSVKSVYRQLVDATQDYINSLPNDGDKLFSYASNIAQRNQTQIKVSDGGPSLSDYGSNSDSNSTSAQKAFETFMKINVGGIISDASTEAEKVENIAGATSDFVASNEFYSGFDFNNYRDELVRSCSNIAFNYSSTEIPDEFFYRTLLAAVLNDPAWLITGGNTKYDFTDGLLHIVALMSISKGELSETIIDLTSVKDPNWNLSNDKTELATALGFGVDDYSSTIPNPDAVSDTEAKWWNPTTWGNIFNTAVYMNHCFLQKAHPRMQDETVKKGIGAAVLAIIGGILVAVATIVIVAIVAGLATVTCGLVLVALAGVACLVGAAITAANQSSSIAAQKAALYKYYSGGNFTGKNKVMADSAAAALGNNSDENCRAQNTPMITRLIDAYGGSKDGVAGDLLAGNVYVSDYTLYGPRSSFSSALGGVSKVYTTQGIVDADKISSKVGSYITNDVNLWGGIYYAYMVDIFGLTIKDNVMSSAQLKTNLPAVPDFNDGNNMDLSSLLNGGDELDSEQAETEKRRDLMQRFDLMTGLSTAADYVSQWLSNTLNGFLIDAHNGITGGSGSGNIANIGGGSLYTGYSSYLATSTLSEMPFTSWVMEYYNIIYTVLMVIILVLAIFMCVTGHRTIRKSIFSVLLMAFILLLPRLCIDSLVTISNTVAQATYKDRFSFWAYAQHQQYMTQMENAEKKDDKIEFLIVTNMQQAEDYYSSDKGVTLKWMSPKKSSYWDALNGITGGSEDSLNMSVFKWLFQGQFSQTAYATDPLATYVYRPYNDIAMSARSWTKDKLTISGTNFMALGKKESEILRESYVYDYAQGIKTYSSKLSVDWDIKPAHMNYDNASGSGSSYKIANAKYVPDVSSSTSLGKIANCYVWGYYYDPVTSLTLDSDSFVSTSDTTDYLKAYPCIKDSSASSHTYAGLQKFGDSGVKGLDVSLELYYQYSESPYYYFYQMFKDAKSRYGNNSMKKLLMSDRFFKYSDVKNTAAVGKGEVTEGTLMDFLDLESLFTFVIPYMQASNYYVDEWTDLWGMSVEAGDPEGFSDNLKGIWKMYAPWVDAMYDTSYARGTIKIAGKRISLDDAINPGAYAEYRPMVFGMADAERNYVATSDMTDVEKRIIKVLENTYIDLMYLNNYSDFDDEVLLSAAAMIATFNFNEAFSENAILGDNITMYPTGYEVKNFSYDSFMRMSLMNTTGASVFSDEDIYTTVLENTSFVTGLLLIVNDAVACYALPVLKMVVLIGLFFLGLLICVGGFLSPPEKIIKFVGKQFLIPVGMFFGILVANILISALFVGEGLTNYVGQRAVTVTTGDPTMTILLMLAINCLVCFGLYMTLKTLLRSFKVSLNWVVGATVGFAGAILHKAKATLHGVAGTGARVAGSVVRGVGNMARTDTITSAIRGASNRRRQSRDSDSEPVKRYKGGSGSDSETDKHNSNVTARSPEGLGHSSGNEANKTPTALNEKSRILDKSDVKSSTETYVGEDGKTHKRKKYHTYARGTTSAERKEAKGYSKQQYAKSVAEINHASQDVTGLNGFKKKRELQKKYMTEAQFANGGKKLSRADKKKYAQKASSEIKAQRAAFATQRSEAKAAYHKSKQAIRDSKKGRMVDVTEEKTAELRAKLKANQEKSAASLAEREQKHQEIQEKRRESAQRHEAARKAAEEKRVADQRKREEDFIHEMNYREAQEKKAKFDRKDNQRKASQVKKADNVAKYLQKNQGGKQAQAARDAGFDLSDKNLSKNSEFRDYVSKQTSKKNTQRSVAKKRGKK